MFYTIYATKQVSKVRAVDYLHVNNRITIYVVSAQLPFVFDINPLTPELNL